MAPTSIHRYESGSSVPDFPVLKKLLEHAVEKNNSEAQEFFLTVLAERMGLSPGALKAGQQGMESLQLLEFQGQQISKQERIRLIALLLCLRDPEGQAFSRPLEALLAPWMGPAEAVVSLKAVSAASGGGLTLKAVAKKSHKSP